MVTDPRDPDDEQRLLRRRRVLGAAGVGLTAAIAGCGSSDNDDDDADDTDNGATSTDDDTGSADDSSGDQDDTQDEDVGSASFDVTGVDHPDEVETNEAHDVVITVENTGDAAGDFEELLEISVGGVDEWENVETLVIEDIDPGETDSATYADISFTDPGTIQYRLGDTQWEYDVTITEASVQSFSGSGQSVEQGIEIEGGLTVLRASHSGDSNFQVSLEDDTEFGESFINVIGGFDGAQAELVDAGEYILDVNADGNWEIDIEQPRSGQGDALPASFSGNGPDVVGPVQFSGTGVATGEHGGESNFQVQILPMTGSFGESIFNEIGQFEGETTYSFDQIGWIDINADGNWTVELE